MMPAMRNRPAVVAVIVAVSLGASLAAWLPAQRRPAAPENSTRQPTAPSGNGQAQTQPPAASQDGLSVFFSPEGGALSAVRLAIGKARRTIDMQAYLLSTKEIARPLTEAQQRGVKIRVLMDSDNAADDNSMAPFLVAAGVPVSLDAEHKEAHNKVMIIDSSILLTGSFNFTRAAEYENAENLLVIEGKPKIVAAYERNFELHLKHSKPYGPGAKRKP